MNENATRTRAGEGERRLAMLFLLMALVWTGLMVAFVRWSYRQSYAAALEMAGGWARNSHTKDVVFRQWASLHGGRIWVESEVGQGSTFFFTFPKRQEETHHAHAGNLDQFDDSMAGRAHGDASQET